MACFITVQCDGRNELINLDHVRRVTTTDEDHVILEFRHKEFWSIDNSLEDLTNRINLAQEKVVIP